MENCPESCVTNGKFLQNWLFLKIIDTEPCSLKRRATIWIIISVQFKSQSLCISAHHTANWGSLKAPLKLCDAHLRAKYAAIQTFSSLGSLCVFQTNLQFRPVIQWKHLVFILFNFYFWNFSLHLTGQGRQLTGKWRARGRMTRRKWSGADSGPSNEDFSLWYIRHQFNQVSCSSNPSGVLWNKQTNKKMWQRRPWTIKQLKSHIKQKWENFWLVKLQEQEEVTAFWKQNIQNVYKRIFVANYK